MNGLPMVFGGLALVLAAGAGAQRRPIAPPGVNAPAPVPKATAPAPEVTAGAAPGQQPVVPVPEPPAQPEQPELLVPDDELGAARAPKQAAAAPVASREVVFRKRLDRHTVTLRVRPARPAPGRTATLVFEVAQLLQPPDPTFGPRRPLEQGDFVATFSLDGRTVGRRRLHPLENAGSYGLHFTAPAAGVYRVELAQRLEAPEIGAVPVTAEFLLGFGTDTPAQSASADEGDGVEVRRSRRTLRVVGARNDGAPPELMADLEERWLALRAALEEPQADPAELAAHAQALQELSARLREPRSSGQSREFGQLASTLEPVAALPASFGQPTAALQAMDRLEFDSCTCCHARLRFRLTDDVGRWPEFGPRTDR
jgi:hypothetical protein